MEAPPAPVAPLESKVIDDGVVLVGRRRYAEAEMKFSRAQVWFHAEGDKGRAAECLFWIGFCREKRGKAGEARKKYEQLIRDYRATPAARQAAERMRRLPAPQPPKAGC